VSGYLFDTTAHARAAAELLDPISIGRTEQLVDCLLGRFCWEIGAGAGGYATWLADQVGEVGWVLATDVNTRRIPRHPRLRPVPHDIAEQPPPVASFDLIHVRCVLAHLPTRRQILPRLVGVLAPGGVLLVEEWDDRPADELVAAAPTLRDAALFAAYQREVDTVLCGRGYDRCWARAVHAALLDHGLHDVRTVVTGGSWPGGSPGCQHLLATHSLLRPLLRGAGMSDRHLDHIASLLADPCFVLHGRPLLSASGRRPAPDD
jgi:SAM-dependent methyltransferase